MNGKHLIPIGSGVVMMPVCAFVLLWQWGIAWVLCPQALAAMFIRQSWSPYDSLGAIGILGLSVGVAYYPLAGFYLWMSLARDRLNYSIRRLVVFHLIWIVLALALAEYRNRIWSTQIG